MGNLLKDGLDYVKLTAWDQPTGILKDVGKGDIGGAFGKWKHTFGDNNDHEEKLFGDVGIRGWVGSHPTETAGAVVASIFGGIYAAGAYGATAAGGSAGAAGAGSGAAVGGGSAAGAGTGAFAAQSSALAATPMSSFGALGGATGGSTAAGSATAMGSYAPATSSLLSMGNAGVGASTATAGSSTFTPAMLTTQGAAASGGTYGAASAPASSSALGTVSKAGFQTSSLGNVTSVPKSNMFSDSDYQLAQKLINQSFKQPEQQSFKSMAGGMPQAPKISSGENKDIFTGPTQGITNRISGNFSPDNPNFQGGGIASPIAPQQRYINI